MNPNIEQLHRIAAKPSRRIIGLMSGTSMDGLDIALCEISGSGKNTACKLLRFITEPYDDSIKQRIAEVFARKEVDLEKLCLLNPWIAKQHAAMIGRALDSWNIDRSGIDCIASHGQTIYHAPISLHGKKELGNATLQIGDGDHLAVETGLITISDFRQKHIAAGGEGAPLAAYGDKLLFGNSTEDRILLNIGGIANFSYLPADPAKYEMSSDTGPGNTMMDAYVKVYFPGMQYDAAGAIARSGKPSEQLLSALKKDKFFQHDFPRTTGPELFNLSYLSAAMSGTGTDHLSREDVLSTLNQFTADTITEAIGKITGNQDGLRIFASGGGVHNTYLLERISAGLGGIKIETTKAVNLDPDAKEAVLFALLANETLAGSSKNFATGVNGMPPVCMGKISFPN